MLKLTWSAHLHLFSDLIAKVFDTLPSLVVCTRQVALITSQVVLTLGILITFFSLQACWHTFPNGSWIIGHVLTIIPFGATLGNTTHTSIT
jgi:hypothetical protein